MTAQDQLKDTLRRRAPGLFGSASRFFHWQRGARFERRVAGVERRVSALTGGATHYGPFAGMRVGDHAVSSSRGPKLVGSYEAEVHFAIAAAFEREYATIIDIGAAEGYYAVGMALGLPAADVIAFETNAYAREQCDINARLNGVQERIDLRGACSVPELRKIALPGAFIICDIDGGEDHLLDPTAVPGLQLVDMLIELHDCFVPGVTSRILERFRETHRVRIVDSEVRNPLNYPLLAGLSARHSALAVNERRPQQSWAVMTCV